MYHVFRIVQRKRRLGTRVDGTRRDGNLIRRVRRRPPSWQPQAPSWIPRCERLDGGRTRLKLWGRPFRFRVRPWGRPRPPGARARGWRTARPKRAPSGGRARGSRRPDRFHPSRRPGRERRKGRKRGAWPGRIRGGSTFSWEFFGWMFQISVHIHTPPPAETAETVFRVNPIWPIAFHCLRHTSVSTPHENTPGPHIPAGFWKWVGPRRHVRGRKGSA